MEAIDIIIEQETFKVNRSSSDVYAFNVFNHATFHIIRKNEFGIWKVVEHRFGSSIPLEEIGDEIDKYYSLRQQTVVVDLPGLANI